MESDWNQDQVIQLIDLYRERPVLWDPGCADYKDRNLKHYAWSEIALGMRMTKIEVQDKMKKVIGQFQRENKKQKSGSGADVKIKWFAYEQLLFLRDKTAPKPTTEVGLGTNEVSKIIHFTMLFCIYICIYIFCIYNYRMNVFDLQKYFTFNYKKL